MMRTFIFIFLSTFFLPSQRLMADDIADIVARNGVVGKEPAPQTWTSAQITNALREIEASWEESPHECSKTVSRILRAKPDDLHALKILFTGVAKLPVPSAEENVEAMWDSLLCKWKILIGLARFTPLCDDFETWEGVASMVGWMRSQIIPNYQRQQPDKARLMNAKTDQEHQEALHDYSQKIAMNKCQQELRNILGQWSTPVDRIRRLAAKMPPDERKRYLDKIKELARSDEEEAKRLDAPVVPTKIIYAPVAVERYYLSQMPPEQRQREIEIARRESTYTEEEMKALEAPYDGPEPVPAEESVQDKPVPVPLMRKILALKPPDYREKAIQQFKKEGMYTEEEWKILEAPYEEEN